MALGASLRKSALLRLSSAASFMPTLQQQRLGHTVRVIVQQDLPDGKAYEGDVMEVKAGYARNFLIPQKKALYATRQNFERLGMQDPDQETAEYKQARIEREAVAGEDLDLKAADLLKYYLRNKVLKIWRNLDTATELVHPGMVDVKAVRKKLSKQLMIDLERHERVHLREEPVIFGELNDRETETMMEALGDSEEQCHVEIKKLGEYIARISLRGGYCIPIRFEVLKR